MGESGLHAYAEEIGLFFEQQGLPRMPGRILGRLMVCDPPHQSAAELAEALQASSGAISMAVRMLIGAGAVERHPVAGTRRTYYRMRPGFWLMEAESKAKIARDWVKLTERGLDLMDGLDPERTRRVQEAHDMYAFLEQEYARIRDRWLDRQENEDI